MIKTVPAGFTIQELRAYLRGDEDARPPEGYQTAGEWARQFGIHIYTMYAVLREAQRAGKLLRQLGKMERIDGRLMTITFYAFAELERQGEGDSAPLE